MRRTFPLHAAADSRRLALHISLEIRRPVFTYRLDDAQSLEPNVGRVLLQLLQQLLLDGPARLAVKTRVRNAGDRGAAAKASLQHLSKVILVSWSMRYPAGRVSLSSHILLMICRTECQQKHHADNQGEACGVR